MKIKPSKKSNNLKGVVKNDGLLRSIEERERKLASLDLQLSKKKDLESDLKKLEEKIKERQKAIDIMSGDGQILSAKLQEKTSELSRIGEKIVESKNISLEVQSSVDLLEKKNKKLQDENSKLVGINDKLMVQNNLLSETAKRKQEELEYMDKAIEEKQKHIETEVEKLNSLIADNKKTAEKIVKQARETASRALSLAGEKNKRADEIIENNLVISDQLEKDKEKFDKFSTRKIEEFKKIKLGLDHREKLVKEQEENIEKAKHNAVVEIMKLAKDYKVEANKKIVEEILKS